MNALFRPLLFGLLMLATVARADPEPEYTETEVGAALAGAIGTSGVGDALTGELQGASFGLRSLREQQWLVQWDGALGFRGGILANSKPYGQWFGGFSHGFGELGFRMQPSNPWSLYGGLRLTERFDVMAHPGTALNALNTINNSDGFGGVTARGAFRAAFGLSYLSGGKSFLVVGFFQEALHAPGFVYPGAAYSEGGIGVRFDVERSFTVYLDALAGYAPAPSTPALGVTDQTVRLELGGALRKTFGNGLWVGLAVSWARDSNHTTYTLTKNSYDTTHAPDFSANVNFGVPLWRLP